MSILDQFLNAQALRNFGGSFRSPTDSPGAFAQTFGNTPQNITPLRTNPTLPNLPGGNNLTFGTNQIGGGIGTGFPGVSMPGTGGIGMANTLAPTRPQRGFGSRIADVFKDQNRFADALAGVAALTGTPAGDALGIRAALRTPEQTGSLGTLYNVFDKQGNYIKQVTSRDPEYANLINQGFKLVPADSTQLEQLGIQKGGLEKETIYNPETGVTTYFGTRLDEHNKARIRIQTARDAAINAANVQLEQIQQALNLIGTGDPSIAQNVINALILEQTALGRDTKAKKLAGILTSLQGKNFMNVVAEMKAASANGGALGSVSERELTVFSNIGFVLDPNTMGTGQALANELRRLQESIIVRYPAIVKYAQDGWNDASLYYPDTDARKNVQISQPVELITEAADNTLTDF